MTYIPQNIWDNFKAIIKQFSSEVNKKQLTWMRYTERLDLRNEDFDPKSYTTIVLPALINYNYMRTWPITFKSDTGALDRQSCQIYLNKEQLRDSGYLNSDNNLDYEPGKDIFILDGLEHKAFGDTSVSQIQSDDLFFTFILKREEQSTTRFKTR